MNNRVLKIETIDFSENGKQIDYGYSYSKPISKFFKSNERFFATYDENVSLVPLSIAVIPFLGNILPISWFAGFDIHVESLDSDFYQGILQIKEKYETYYPQLKKRKSTLVVQNIVENKSTGTGTGLLFSGGVDAYTTFLRHMDETPDLITILGADVEIDDHKQWDIIKSFNEKETLLSENRKRYASANMRTFYTHHVDFLLPNLGWWGKVQYGMALTCMAAPLSYIHGYEKVYIASTRSVHMEFLPWGSMPETDNLIRWAGANVIHDAYELSRFEKTEYIVKTLNNLQKEASVRVCYSEANDGLNCSKCEKCLRTIFNIMLLGDNPRSYGFKADEKVYAKLKAVIKNGFRTSGVLNYWTELLEKGRETQSIFYFENQEQETREFNEVLRTISNSCDIGVVKPSKWAVIKFKLINRNRKLFNYYLSVRRKFN